MARKNNYYLEEAAKRSSAIVITLCVIAIILTVAAILTVLAWGSDGFINWNLPEWFNSWGTAAQAAPVTESAASCGYMLIVPGCIK